MTTTIRIHTECAAQHLPKEQYSRSGSSIRQDVLSRLLRSSFIILVFLWAMVDLSVAFHSSSLSNSNNDPRRRRRNPTIQKELRPSLTNAFFVHDGTVPSTKPPSTSQRNQPTIQTALFLVPSQVSRGMGSRQLSMAKTVPLRSHNEQGLPETSTSTQDYGSTETVEFRNAATGSSNPNQKRKRRRKKKASQSSMSTTMTATTAAPADVTTTKNKSPPRRSGNLPDIYWRCISMDHLREHPRFVPLPPPESIQRLDRMEDIRLFRQESWQWDTVHEGRCTTSQTAAALGFLEPTAAKFLGVPRSWQRGGLGAYVRLRKPALQTLEEMNAVLCGNADSLPEDVVVPITPDPPSPPPTSLWQTTTTTNGNGFPFAAKYMVRTTREEIRERKETSKKLNNFSGFDSSVRMLWGTAQESTALLTALNFFWKKDNGVVLKEVGMCGGGLDILCNPDDTGSKLLVGATPDGLLCYPDGTIEALEVKNHCPFFSTVSSRNKVGHRHPRGHRFMIRSFDFVGYSVPPQYIPQLMMEMFCVGEECRSAVMVRQTATSGALILRVRRDDEWIQEMIYWLGRFKRDYVDREEAPPTNFFLEESSDQDTERYMAFLERTRAIQEKVEIVGQVPHNEIQRAMGAQPGITNLFLD